MIFANTSAAATDSLFERDGEMIRPPFPVCPKDAEGKPIQSTIGIHPSGLLPELMT